MLVLTCETVLDCFHVKQYWIVFKQQGALTTLFRPGTSMNPNLPELPGLGAKHKKSAKPNNVLYAHQPHAIIDDQISADGRRHVVAKKTRLSAQELGQETLMEDTTTLSRANQADNFSYLLGEDFSDFINTSSGTDDVGGDELIRVHVHKRYPSSVCEFTVSCRVASRLHCHLIDAIYRTTR